MKDRRYVYGNAAFSPFYSGWHLVESGPILTCDMSICSAAEYSKGAHEHMHPCAAVKLMHGYRDQIIAICHIMKSKELHVAFGAIACTYVSPA